MRTKLTLSCAAILLTLTASCSRDPQKVKLQYVIAGDKSAAKSDYAEAIIQYRKAVAADSHFGPARFKLAEAYERTGDLRNALREYVRAADLMPENVEAQIRAGNGLLNSGQFPEAKARALAVLARDPKNTTALIIMGNSMAALKDFKGAITTVEQAVDADPQQVLGYTNLGALQMAAGDRLAAENAFKRATEIDPKSESAHFGLANYYWAANRFAEAERELKIAVENDPKSAAANRALAVFYGTTRRSDDAERYLKAYATLTTDPGPKLWLADFYVLRNRTQDAVAVLEPLVKTKDGFAPAKVRLAAFDFTGGRRAQAYSTLGEVLKREPRNQEALLEKARFQLAEGKPAEALASASAVLAINPRSAGALFLKGSALKDSGSIVEALSAFQDTLLVTPGATPALIQIADINLAQGDAALAIQYASQAVKTSPQSGVAHLLLAKSLIRSGNLLTAEPEVMGLAKGSPASVQVQTLLGDYYWAKRDLTRSREAYERALGYAPSLEALAGVSRVDLTEKKNDAVRARIDSRTAKTPDDPALLILAGKLYMDLGDPQKSESTFRHVLEIDPANLQAYSALGAIYVSQHRLEAAIAEYDAMAARDKRAAPVALTMAGTLLSLQGKPDEARARFEHALALDPEMPIAANNLAWDYAERGENLDVALKWAQNAKAKLPKSPYPSDTLGWIYYKKGLASLAVTTLTEASTQAPADPGIRYRLGLAYLKNGDEKNARASLEQALKLSPDFKEAAEAKKALATIKS